MNLIFSFNFDFNIIALQTIWSIAISMIILGLMIWLPFQVILATGLLIVLGHNLLDFYEARNPSPGWWYDLLHRVGFHNLWDNHNLLILYPFLSWAGLMMMGYCFGHLFIKFEGKQRKKILIGLGLGLIVLFVILRFINLYGNPFKWSVQENDLATFFSFMNVQKYPPSLLFMCATIGPALILLAFMQNIKNGFTRFVTVYGRVPFLYYILHFLLIHILSSIFYFARGHSRAEGVADRPGFIPNFIDPTEGYSLAVVYLLWIGIVLALYPVCKWFSDYKRKHKKWWLSYL
jgi:uncharacterized membrane protein